MKTWAELTEDEKGRVREKLINDQLRFIVEIGPSYFQYGEDELKAAAEDAFEKAENKRTPWFVSSYIWGSPLIQEYIKNYVEMIANEDITYLDPGEENPRFMYIPWEGTK
jgi:hypothetical protein